MRALPPSRRDGLWFAAVGGWILALLLLLALSLHISPVHWTDHPWYRGGVFWVVLVAGPGCITYTASVVRASFHDEAPADIGTSRAGEAYRGS